MSAPESADSLAGAFTGYAAANAAVAPEAQTSIFSPPQDHAILPALTASSRPIGQPQVLITPRLPTCETPLIELADNLAVNEQLVMTVLEAMGAEASFTAEEFGCVTEAEFQGVMDGLVNGVGALPTIAEKAKLRKLYKSSKDLCALKTQLLLSPPPPPTVTTLALPAPKQDDSRKRAFEETLEQGARGTFEILEDEEITLLRNLYVAVCGREPPESARPTSEQVAALQARLKSKRAPYVDFAIFGPFGGRDAKMRRFETKKN
jgi:hypothetical protein